jgi:hypothetical protein
MVTKLPSKGTRRVLSVTGRALSAARLGSEALRPRSSAMNRRSSVPRRLPSCQSLGVTLARNSGGRPLRYTVLMNLVSDAMAVLTFAVAASACSAGNNPSRDNGTNPSQSDGGKATACGCTVTNVPLDSLPDQLTDFGSPTEAASAVSGTWTNNDGDKLVITPAASGTYAMSTGGACGGSGGSGPCSAESYVAVQAVIELDSRDGRFAESLLVSLHLAPRSPAAEGFFQFDEPVSDVKGSYRTEGPATGAIHWTGMFSPDSWFVSGEVAQFISSAGAGSAMGGGQAVGFASFDTRLTGGEADAAAE